MTEQELSTEIKRLNERFKDADENKLQAMSALIEQAAYETLFLKELNETAMKTGLVKVHPDNPTIQIALPVSKAITQHSATLTNILDKLCRNLCVELDDDDEGLDEYE